MMLSDRYYVLSHAYIGFVAICECVYVYVYVYVLICVYVVCSGFGCFKARKMTIQHVTNLK